VKHLLYLVLAVLALAARADAQTPDSYVARYYNVGASAPVQTESLVATAIVCNQASPATVNTVNPTRIIWDDAAVAGRVCIYTAPTSGPLFSMPFGVYEATLAAVNAAGSGPESARSPFSRLAVLPAPTGVKVTR
jgi:hypothetical protein